VAQVEATSGSQLHGPTPVHHLTAGDRGENDVGGIVWYRLDLMAKRMKLVQQVAGHLFK
jgi:hypothetical protein